MSPDDLPIRSPGSRNITVPWMWFIILATLLLLAEHNSPMDPRSFEDREASDVIAAQESGNLRRRVIYVLMGASGAIALLLRKKNRALLRNRRMTYLLFSLAAWILLTFLWSDSPGITLRRFVLIGLLTTCALGVVKRWTPEVIIRFIAFSATFHLAVGIMTELFWRRFAPFSGGYRFSGTLHPNEQGLQCVFVVLAALAASRTSPRLQELVFKSVAAVGLTVLVLTKSRTSMGALVVGLAVFYLLVLQRSQRWRLIVATLLAVAGIALIAGELAFNKFHQIALMGRTSDEITTLTGRVPLWHECLYFVQQRPLRGYGFEAFWTSDRIADISDYLEWNIPNSHSAYIDLVLSLGVVGLVLHTAILVTALVLARKRYRATRKPEFAFAAAVLTTYVVAGFLESLTLIVTTAVTFYGVAIVLMVSYGREDVVETPLASGETDSPALARNRRSGLART